MRSREKRGEICCSQIHDERGEEEKIGSYEGPLLDSILIFQNSVQ